MGIQTSRHPSISPLGAKHARPYNYYSPWRIAKIGMSVLSIAGGLYGMGRGLYEYYSAKKEAERTRQRVNNDKSMVPAGYAPDSYYGDTTAKQKVWDQTRIAERRQQIEEARLNRANEIK